MNNYLEKWRRQIDTIDEKILKLLARRVAIVKRIGQYKKQNNISALDKSRWKGVIKTSLQQAEILELPKEFVEKIFTLIHKYSLKIQK